MTLKMKTCPYCNGTGKDPGARGKDDRCLPCAGKGEIPKMSPLYQAWEKKRKEEKGKS